jgi:hypothetical protein
MYEWKSFEGGDQPKENQEASQAQEWDRQLVRTMEMLIQEGLEGHMQHHESPLGGEAKDNFGLALQDLSRLREKKLSNGYQPPFEWKAGMSCEGDDSEEQSEKSVIAHIKMSYYNPALLGRAHFAHVKDASNTKIIAHIETDICTRQKGRAFGEEFTMNEYILGFNEGTRQFEVRIKSGWFEEPTREPFGTDWQEPSDEHLQNVTNLLQTVYQLANG